MRTPLLVTFLVTVLAVLSVLLWKFDQIFLNDKLKWGESQARGQLSAISRSMEVEIQSIADSMDMAILPLAAMKKDYPVNAPYSRFHMIAKVKSLPGQEWLMEERYFREGTPTKAWASNYTVLALKMLRESDIQAGHSAVISLLDPQRKTYFLILTRSKSSEQWYAALSGTEIFQDIIDRQKGQLSTMFIVNLQGQALAHSVPEYVGSLLSEDPLVAEIMNGESAHGAGRFKDLRDEDIQGFYEQVGDTNTFIVVTTAIEKLIGDQKKLKFQILLAGLGLILLGAGVLLFVTRSEKEPVAKKLPPLPNLKLNVPALNTETAKTSPQVQQAAAAQMASSLSQELKAPLAAILGNIQILKSQTQDPSMRQHLEKIEREARDSRDVVSKLLTFSGDAKAKNEKSNLEKIVHQALKNVEAKILSKGIKLDKKIAAVPDMMFDPILMTKVIEGLLLNAIEALERAPHKMITVQLLNQGMVTELSVNDTGEGMEKQIQEKAFDPFFTTRSSQGHVGLGLSMAMGVAKDAKGKIEIHSQPGQGTLVKMIFVKDKTDALALPIAPVQKDNEPPPAPEDLRSVPQPIIPPNPLFSESVMNEKIRMIEEIDPLTTPSITVPVSKADENKTVILEATPQAPPVPAPEIPEPRDSLIGKPNIQFTRKTSVVETFEVQIRRPGEHI